MNETYVHKELSGEIIGSAIAVINELKPGLEEKIYENSLVIELLEKGLKIDQQKQFPVYYKSHSVGKLIPDLIVEDKIVVDTKVVGAFNESHIAQMLGYLIITGLKLAILLNFKNAKLEFKRIVRS